MQGRTRMWMYAVAMMVLVASWGGAAVTPAVASDPIFIGWSNLLPAWVYTFSPSSSNDCSAGRPACVQQTINTMNRRWTPLDKSCDHKAVFSLAYLLTTKQYAETAAQPGFYNDVAWVNHEDAVFSQFYFRAYDDYAAGHLSRVPEAWQIAFDAANRRTVTGVGDLLLGMSGHVNRDLPFVLAGVGIVAPNGKSRKPDHEKINVMLNQVVTKLLDKEAALYDPTMNDAKSPYGIGYTALMQLLVGWREQAWNNAELLVSAPTAAARALVAQQIESSAAATARSIVASNLAPPTYNATRDAYCASTH
ncbi:MAG: hypothetical protein QOK30_157 [Nocardioidaceae bacterium]|nr:hypothetical protein [Nocardioidaceae bacterium]